MITQVWFDEMASLSSDDDDGLDHVTECHNDDRALCGTDVTDTAWYQEGDAEFPCVVCEDLRHFHCGCFCGCCDGCES